MKEMKIFLFAVCLLVINASMQSQESVSMGVGYEDDIYFSLNEGVISSADRAEWDLGFYTSPWSAGIITNGGSGIELYVYPKGDTSAWMSIDTNGMANWPVLYNGEDSWENGAFNRNSKNHPDYGWGVYSSITHDVVGDSLFVIKLQDGTYQKLWIVKKVSTENKYVFRYADLDNGQEKEKTLLNNDYTSMNFSYFDFQSGAFFEREPEKTSWDILFTKYQAMQPQGVPYPVVGVLNNVNMAANRLHPVTLDFNTWYNQPMDSSKAVIGFNWKYFDMGSFQWSIEDSLLFFAQSLDGNIYKLYFTMFEGTSTGNIEFELETVSLLGINDFVFENKKLSVAPNPARDFVMISWSKESKGPAELRIYSVNGKEVINKSISASENSLKQARIDVSGLQQGMYIISIISEGKVITEKLMID